MNEKFLVVAGVIWGLAAACGENSSDGFVDITDSTGGDSAAFAGAPVSGGARGEAGGDGGLSDGGGAIGGGARVDGAVDGCSETNRTPCARLTQHECKARSYCREVIGEPWNVSQPKPTGNGLEDPQYIGCVSLCDGLAGDETFSCVYDPVDPTTCFYTRNFYGPDGWSVFIDCEDPPLPAGACTN